MLDFLQKYFKASKSLCHSEGGCHQQNEESDIIRQILHFAGGSPAQNGKFKMSASNYILTPIIQTSSICSKSPFQLLKKVFIVSF